MHQGSDLLGFFPPEIEQDTCCQDQITWLVLESNYSVPKPAPTYAPPWVAYDAYAHAVSWSGNANANQFFSSLTGMIYDVHSPILKKKCGHNEVHLRASLSHCLWIMILPAKIMALGILARIPSISTKETAVVSIAWLPCPLNPLDISESKPRFGKEVKQGETREARMAKNVPVSVACYNMAKRVFQMI